MNRSVSNFACDSNLKVVLHCIMGQAQCVRPAGQQRVLQGFEGQVCSGSFRHYAANNKNQFLKITAPTMALQIISPFLHLFTFVCS